MFVTYKIKGFVDIIQRIQIKGRYQQPGGAPATEVTPWRVVTECVAAPIPYALQN